MNGNFRLLTAALPVLAAALFAGTAAAEAPCAPFPEPWIDGTRSDEPAIQVQKLGPDTFVLRQSVRTNFEAPFLYLLFGRRSALLLDTGAGGLEVRPTVDRLIADWRSAHGDRPLHLVVAHSHSHKDHHAGDQEFEGRPDTTLVGLDVADVAEVFGVAHWPDGLGRLDLGGRVLDVIPTPGHQTAHIMVYDRRTRLLLSGDALYPGRLYVPVNHFDEERASVERLAQFAVRHPVSCVLGAHIEMTRTPGQDYPGGAPRHPDEHDLQLPAASIVELRDAVRSMTPRSPPVRRPDFIVTPTPARPD